MPSEKQLPEIKEIIEYLEKDTAHAEMREDMANRNKLYTLRDISDLAEHFRQGRSIEAPSPMVQAITMQVLADVLAYPSTVTVLADSKEDEEKANNLERSTAMLWSLLNDGRRVDHKMRFHVLASSYHCPILHIDPDNERNPWTVEVPSPLTCFFPIGDAPMRPAYMAQRYRQLVRNVESTYSGKKKDRGEKLQLFRDGGKNWKWEPIGSARPADSSGSASNVKFMEDCEMLRLDDGEYIYRVAMNSDGKTGEIVSCVPNITGAVAGLVIPGGFAPLPDLQDNYWPALFPIMQMTLLINRVRAKRGIRSENHKPTMVVLQDPDKMGSTEANERIMQALADPSAGFVFVPGVGVEKWEQLKDEDLDKLEQSYERERDRYLGAILESSDIDLVKESTANAYLHYAETRSRQQAPMLSMGDYGKAKLLEMCLTSLPKINREIPLLGMGGERYGKGGEVSIGERSILKPADVNFGYRVLVETQSTTSQEQRARVMDWEHKYNLGIATPREGLTAAGYTDEDAQIEELAISRGVELVTPQMEAEGAAVVMERIRMRSGQIVKLAPPAQQGAVAPSPVGVQPMQPANVQGPTGGSGEAVA